jgi:hypothetical protein
VLFGLPDLPLEWADSITFPVCWVARSTKSQPPSRQERQGYFDWEIVNGFRVIVFCSLGVLGVLAVKSQWKSCEAAAATLNDRGFTLFAFIEMTLS